MMYVVNSKDARGMFRALEVLCRESGYFCYYPLEVVETIISMTWAETLQLVPSECFEDEACAVEALNMFGTVLQIAIQEDYVFRIEPRVVAEVLKKLPLRGIGTKASLLEA